MKNTNKSLKFAYEEGIRDTKRYYIHLERDLNYYKILFLAFTIAFFISAGFWVYYEQNYRYLKSNQVSDNNFCKYISQSSDAVMINGYCYWGYNAGCEHFLDNPDYYEYKIYGGLKEWGNTFKINNSGVR